MDKLSFPEALGKKIITSQQNSFEAGNDLEDISHITNIKRIILAISDYLKSEDVPQDGINAMVDSLKQLSKGLFVTGCVSVKDEDEDEDDVREELEPLYIMWAAQLSLRPHRNRTHHEKLTRDLFVYGSGWLKTGGDFHFGKP